MINDEQLREVYSRGLPSGDGRPPLDDLAAERLRRVVEREGSESERLHTIDGLLTTAAGRAELEIAWAAARAAQPRSTRSTWLRGAAAALLLTVGVGAAWMLSRPQEQVMRGDDSPITLVAPVGSRSAADARHFVWRGVEGAQRYTLVVVDTAGNEVYARDTGDTTVTLPDSVSLHAGAAYLWWVQAQKPLGESVTAVTQRLFVTQ
jgi:hypothetical protein